MLYTDGLFKNRTDDVDTQLERLRDTVSRMDPTLLSTLVSSGTGPGTRFDEAVLLMATGLPVPGAADIVVWELPPGSRRRVRRPPTGQGAARPVGPGRARRHHGAGRQ